MHKGERCIFLFVCFYGWIFYLFFFSLTNPDQEVTVGYENFFRSVREYCWNITRWRQHQNPFVRKFLPEKKTKIWQLLFHGERLKMRSEELYQMSEANENDATFFSDRSALYLCSQEVGWLRKPLFVFTLNCQLCTISQDVGSLLKMIRHKKIIPLCKEHAEIAACI